MLYYFNVSHWLILSLPFLKWMRAATCFFSLRAGAKESFPGAIFCLGLEMRLSRNRIRLIPYCIHGQLRWSDFEYGGKGKPASAHDTSLAEWVFQMGIHLMEIGLNDSALSVPKVTRRARRNASFAEDAEAAQSCTEIVRKLHREEQV